MQALAGSAATAPGPAYIRRVARDARPLARQDDPGRGIPPAQVRVAGVLVGVQALAAALFTGALVVRASGSQFGTGLVLGQAAFFVLVAATVGAVAVGLLTGRRWARTPALVVQLLLLPVVYSLIGPSRQIVLGLVSGAVVFAAFMLLLNERSRAWSMGLDADDPGAR